MKASRIRALVLLLMALSLSACSASKKKPRDAAGKITVDAVQSKAVALAQRYVGHIHAHHNIMVRTPEAGYLAAVQIKSGQAVKQGDVLFQVKGPTDSVRRASENADNVISVKAPFDGVIGRLLHQEGSLVQSGETLTTLSDNDQLWVYFNIPEARYLEYRAAQLDQHHDELKIELVLANGKTFDHLGTLGAIAADFDVTTGGIPFRADFPNPDHLLRHGQIGTVLISRMRDEAIVVPQRATFEDQQKRYVYVVDNDNVAHQREIVVRDESDDDLFVVTTGLSADDKIVVEGVRHVHDGDALRYQARRPKKVVTN